MKFHLPYLSAIAACAVLAACGGATDTNTSTSTKLLATGTACYTSWQSSVAYTAGATVSVNGVNYRAAYWTQNQNPATNSGAAGSGQPWVMESSCGGGDDGSVCQIWAEGVSYTVGQVVSYQGVNYTALQSHTAYAGTNWNPAVATSLWKSGGTCGGNDDGGNDKPCDKPASVALVVDSAFATPLKSELSRFADDIRNDLDVCVKTVSASASSKPSQIRGSLKNLWTTAGLQGAILIGDIPGAQVGDLLFQGQIYPSYLTDAYYEILNDAYWNDANSNGIFDRSFDIEGNGKFELRYDQSTPERHLSIWAGRLTPPTAMSSEERISRLRAYFDRNHAYRTGQKVYDNNVLYLNSLSHNGDSTDGELNESAYRAQAASFYYAVNLNTGAPATGLTAVWNNDLAVQLADWRTAIQRQREYAFINVHGAPDYEWFGGANNMMAQDFMSTPSNALLLDLASCNNGNFNSPNYFAGYALFSGQTLAVRAFTEPVFIVGSDGSGTDQRMLTSGLTLGEMRKATGAIDISILLGDPTLRLRKPTTGAGLTVSSTVLNFSDLPASSPANTVAVKDFTFTNNSTRAIQLLRGNTSYASWNGGGVLFRYGVSPEGYQTMIDPSVGVNFTNAEQLVDTILPGASKTMSTYFVTNSNQTKPGTYHWEQIFYTNSTATPVIKVEGIQRVN